MRDGCAEASCREEHITVQVYEWRFSFTWPCHFSSAVPSSFPLVSYLLHLITGRFISIQQPCQRVRRRQAWSCVLRFFASSLELHHSCTLTFRSLTYKPDGRMDEWMDGGFPLSLCFSGEKNTEALNPCDPAEMSDMEEWWQPAWKFDKRLRKESV